MIYIVLKYCHENAEMQKRKFDDVTLQYSITYKHPEVNHQRNVILIHCW